MKLRAASEVPQKGGGGYRFDIREIVREFINSKDKVAEVELGEEDTIKVSHTFRNRIHEFETGKKFPSKSNSRIKVRTRNFRLFLEKVDEVEND